MNLVLQRRRARCRLIIPRAEPFTIAMTARVCPGPLIHQEMRRGPERGMFFCQRSLKARPPDRWAQAAGTRRLASQLQTFRWSWKNPLFEIFGSAAIESTGRCHSLRVIGLKRRANGRPLMIDGIVAGRLSARPKCFSRSMRPGRARRGAGDRLGPSDRRQGRSRGSSSRRDLGGSWSVLSVECHCVSI